MAGIGGLWVAVEPTSINAMALCDCEPDLAILGAANMVLRFGIIPTYDVGDVRTWSPPEWPLDLLVTSFVFRQSHDFGNTKYQKDLMEKKQLHTYKAFGQSPNNLVRHIKPNIMDNEEFYSEVRKACRQIITYAPKWCFFIIRNLIYHKKPLDEVGDHIISLQSAGFDITELIPRRLCPGGPTQWKLARDPNTQWTRTEWILRAVPPSR
jgi:hypothetical protein